MNIFDIGIILLFVMFLITGFKHGVIRELVSLIGIVIVFIIAYSLKGVVGNFLCLLLPFIKFKGALEGITSINILLYQTIAFMIVFSVLLSIYAIFIKISKVLQKIVNLTIILWLPSKILGAIVSFIKGYIILFVVLLILMIPLRNQCIFTDSYFVNRILYNTPILSTNNDSYVNITNEVYNLSNKVVKKQISKEEANKRAINIMLKYKIVDEKTIELLKNKL